MRLVKYRGYWCAAWSEQRCTRRTSLRLKATESREDAERAFIDFRNSFSRPAETVRDIMNAYLDDKQETATSIARLRDAWKRLEPHFGKLRPDQVDRLSCRAYTTSRREDGVQSGTIRKELSTLRSGLRWHDRNTPAQFELPANPPPKDRFLRKHEVDRLIRSAGSPHIELAILLMWSTAGRKEAILTLKWEQIDFERGLISLTAKGEEKRRKGRATVPMTERVRAALLEAKRGSLTDYVIEWAEKPVRDIKRGFANAAKKAGLRDVTPHVLRHSAAVAMAEAGVPMSEIAAVLGHTDSRITERVYARYSPTYLRGAISALE